jgi:Predicted glycosyl hydrolase
MAQCPYSSFEYTVQSGDTPAAIARKFGVGERELLAQGAALVPGSTVKIPCPAGACRGGAFYVLQRGDTLLRVARRGGLTLKQLLAANPYLNPGRYAPGQVIIIPAAPARRGGAGTYTLAEGERLFDALRRLRVDITTFCSLNPGIKPMDVRPGQTIRIPRDIPYDGC